MLAYELAIATGQPPNLHAGKINTLNHPKIVDAMLDLIKAESDIQKIQVKNTADVLDAIAKGKMSIQDAARMVSLLAIINGEVGDSKETNKIVIEIATGGAT